MARSDRKTTPSDLIRKEKIIMMMCHDFNATQAEITSDLADIIHLHDGEAMDLLGEIWMTYS